MIRRLLLSTFGVLAIGFAGCRSKESAGAEIKPHLESTLGEPIVIHELKRNFNEGNGDPNRFIIRFGTVAEPNLEIPVEFTLRGGSLKVLASDLPDRLRLARRSATLLAAAKESLSKQFPEFKITLNYRESETRGNGASAHIAVYGPLQEPAFSQNIERYRSALEHFRQAESLPKLRADLHCFEGEAFDGDHAYPDTRKTATGTTTGYGGTDPRVRYSVRLELPGGTTADAIKKLKVSPYSPAARRLLPTARGLVAERMTAGLDLPEFAQVRNGKRIGEATFAFACRRESNRTIAETWVVTADLDTAEILAVAASAKP